jgi:hypothetical protein
MVRKTNWSRRLPHSVTPLDGERMVELVARPAAQRQAAC